MSSAVNLVCSQCHTAEHPIEIDGAECSSCHGNVHEAPQALLLGLASTSNAATPSSHFMDGLTCRSCHLAPSGSPDGALNGSGEACVGCHRPEYATVLRWWRSGLRDRMGIVGRYITQAEMALGSRDQDDPAAQATSAARATLASVEAGGGEHNISLAHRLLEESVASAEEAYRLAGQSAPAAPELGRLPRQGICAYCHYEMGQLGFTEAMDDAFHREVLGGG